MRIIIDNIDDVIGNQIALSAKQNHRTIEEEVATVLNEKFSDFSVSENTLNNIRKKTGEPLEKFQMIQEIFIKKEAA